ncbi:glyoxalase [Fischerella thermalis CCMEE 5201]|jgi:catechol 2,3-dioxygenase-like lactoylglutathione lyase family enzyme|nr:glyoxalase [Fischerella thermalis CCMEE 5201]
MKPQLNIITLGVTDLHRSLQFYQDGLGWRKSSASQDDIIFFQLSAVVLALYPREKLAEDARVSPFHQGFSGFTVAYNTRNKEEVDEILQLAESVGAKITKPAEHVFWGGYSGYFADPDDYLWEVAWNPFFELAEDGRLLLL